MCASTYHNCLSNSVMKTRETCAANGCNVLSPHHAGNVVRPCLFAALPFASSTAIAASSCSILVHHRLYGTAVHATTTTTALATQACARRHIAARAASPRCQPFRDRQQLSWLDPFCQGAWTYLIDLAENYAFDKRMFGTAKIRVQIDAAESAGSNGWMHWNRRNIYNANGSHACQPHALPFAYRAHQLTDH